MWQLSREIDDNEYKEKYDIDHCRPIATFNLSDPDDKYDAFFGRIANLCLKVKISVKVLNVIYG